MWACKRQSRKTLRSSAVAGAGSQHRLAADAGAAAGATAADCVGYGILMLVYWPCCEQCGR
jgi:hypothetical protein